MEARRSPNLAERRLPQRRSTGAFHFGRRFAGTAIVIGAVLTIALTYAQTRSAEKAYYESLESSGQVILETLASLCATNLSEMQTRQLSRQLRLIADMDRFAYIDVSDVAGRQLISAAHPGRGH